MKLYTAAIWDLSGHNSESSHDKDVDSTRQKSVAYNSQVIVLQNIICLSEVI